MTLRFSTVHQSTFEQGCGGKLVMHERGCTAYGQLNREEGRENKQGSSGGEPT